MGTAFVYSTASVSPDAGRFCIVHEIQVKGTTQDSCTRSPVSAGDLRMIIHVHVSLLYFATKSRSCRMYDDHGVRRPLLFPIVPYFGKARYSF